MEEKVAMKMNIKDTCGKKEVSVHLNHEEHLGGSIQHLLGRILLTVLWDKHYHFIQEQTKSYEASNFQHSLTHADKEEIQTVRPHFPWHLWPMSKIFVFVPKMHNIKREPSGMS